jgi:hypothetical protein
MKWLNRCPGQTLPYFCLVKSQKEMDAILKKFSIKEKVDFVNPGADATTHTFMNEKGENVCVVGLKPSKGKSKSEVTGLLVHEAVHIWQRYVDDIGEKHPSDEFMAYGIQAIATQLLMSHWGEL